MTCFTAKHLEFKVHKMNVLWHSKAGDYLAA